MTSEAEDLTSNRDSVATILTYPIPVNLLDTIVHVRVGTERKDFGIHQGLLCKYSGYFKAALSGNFKESKEGIVVLEDEDSEIFSRFYFWLYASSAYQNTALKDITIEQLLELYVFAEGRLIPGLQNHVVDLIIQIVNDHSATTIFPSAAISSAWDYVSERSQLRTFLVDVFYTSINLKESFEDNTLVEFPRGLLARVAVRGQRFTDSDSIITQAEVVHKRCEKYHVHNPNDPSCPALKDLE